MLYVQNISANQKDKANAFSFQHFLESEKIYISEINKICASNSAYVKQWILIDKATSKITPLNVRSVDSSNLVEEVFFEEGYLKFNLMEATFIEKFNSNQHRLTKLHLMAIPSAIHQAVANFIY